MSARPKLADLVAPELRPYLTYSFGAHVALAFAALWVLGLSRGPAKSTVYTIDFVGGPGNIITSVGQAGGGKASPPPAAAAAPARAVPPSGEFDEFGRRRRHGPLPRPSLLRGAQAPREREEAPAQTPASGNTSAASASSAGAPSSGGGGDAGVSADMPNFPYPWYITRVRQMLWAQWQSRMPRGGGESVIVFSLLPNGSVVDLRTETSSGDASFDLAALAAVQDAGPYPPLPREFREPFLKVHVTLRSQ